MRDGSKNESVNTAWLAKRMSCEQHIHDCSLEPRLVVSQGQEASLLSHHRMVRIPSGKRRRYLVAGFGPVELHDFGFVGFVIFYHRFAPIPISCFHWASPFCPVRLNLALPCKCSFAVKHDCLLQHGLKLVVDFRPQAIQVRIARDDRFGGPVRAG